MAVLSKNKIYKIVNPDTSHLGIYPKETAKGCMVPDVCVRMLIEVCLLLPKKKKKKETSHMPINKRIVK